MNTKYPRFIPENAQEVTRAGLPAIVYTFTSKQGQPAAIAYIGEQSKNTWHYRFMSPKQREQKIDEFFNGIAQREEFKHARKSERVSFNHGYKIGDILYSSWGYDQTNIEFYQVIDTTQKTVTFREIAQDTKATGFMCADCMPVKNSFIGKPYTRTAKPSSNEKGLVKFAEHDGGYMRHLWEWDGKPKGSTSYA